MEGIRPLPELTKWRESHEPRLSLTGAALVLGVSKPTVSRWETGTRKVNRKKLSTVSEKTGIPRPVLRPDIAEQWGEP
jgi:DNA-binding transcriptional regulator YdaS (Cro superfamily)